MLFKLSNLNSNLALTLGYLYPALNNSAQGITAVLRETENKAYAKFAGVGGGGGGKEGALWEMCKERIFRSVERCFRNTSNHSIILT